LPHGPRLSALGFSTLPAGDGEGRGPYLWYPAMSRLRQKKIKGTKHARIPNAWSLRASPQQSRAL